jgi:hypothetical protein
MELTVFKDKAVKAYKNASKDGRALLADLFGKDVFTGKLTERLNNFYAVCLEAGVNEADYAVPSGTDWARRAKAFENRLDLIAEVFNEGWIARIADTSQAKYYPWFKIIEDSSAPGGFRLARHFGPRRPPLF